MRNNLNIEVMNSRDVLCEKVIILFEKYKIYLYPDLRLEDVAGMLNVSKEILNSIFENEIEVSFDKFLYSFRIHHARMFVFDDKMPYRYAWKISGFKCKKELETVWDNLII